MNGWAWLVEAHQHARAKIKLFTYSRVLAHLGSHVYIHPSAVFNWPEKIHIGDGCNIYQGVVLNARTSHGTGIRLGKGVKIHEYSYLDPYGGYIHLDDYVGIGHHCVIGGHGGLTVGKYTMISGLTYIVPANHLTKRCDVPYVLQGETRRGISIGENVWVGAGCAILDGVSIGNNAVIGAGAVVNKNIPENVLAAGVPARVMRQLAS